MMGSFSIVVLFHDLMFLLKEGET